MMTIIDTHTHLYLEEFDDDRKEMMERAKLAGVSHVLLPAVDFSTHTRLFEMENAWPGMAIAMMGLHPCSVKEDYRVELKRVEQELTRRKYIAVGEIGLDFYWDISFREQQLDAFRQQIGWAIQYDIPVSIHSRQATDECISVIAEFQKQGPKGVFHCFSGSIEQARKIIDLGFLLGIGGVLTFKNGGLDQLVKEIDTTYMVLETDAPYLAPVPFRGKRNESSYLSYVLQKLADCKETGIEEIARITTNNAQKLFGL